MAKELPYFKFEPSEWLEGEIQIISDTSIVCFINLCSGYWLKLGKMSYAFALHKYCRRDSDVLHELISNDIIEKDGDNIKIKFLDQQFEEFKGISEKRSKAANKRWKNNTVNQKDNASALQLDNKSNAIREEEIKEDKKRRDNSITKKTFKKSDFKKSLLDLGANEQHIDDWFIVRDKKKASYTKTAFKKIYNECKNNNFPIANAVKFCAERSWVGFEYQWILNTSNKNQPVIDISDDNR